MNKERLTPTAILRAWQDAHGSLSPAQQKRFLEKLELRTLARLPKASVLRAINLEKKLAQIVVAAQEHSDQMMIAQNTKKASESFRPSPIDKQARASELRSNQTAAERLLGERLRDRSENWFAQVPMRGYILDFYCPKALLAVEVDGASHRLTPATDAKRDEILKSIGIETLRVSNEAVTKTSKTSDLRRGARFSSAYLRAQDARVNSGRVPAIRGLSTGM